MDLLEKIDLYGESKQSFDELKKEVDELNKDIKTEMKNSNQETLATDKYKITVKDVVSESFDEDKLLLFIKSMLTDRKFSDMVAHYGIIRQKEYVDMEALENAIYSGEFDATILKPYKTQKISTRLTIKTVK